MKYTINRAIPLSIFLMAISMPLFAQSCNPNIPIDGGLSVLIAAGAGYGIKKLYSNKETK